MMTILMIANIRVFVRFREMKGEIRVKKAIFGVIFFFRGLDLLGFGNPPTHIWENFPPKKTVSEIFPNGYSDNNKK